MLLLRGLIGSLDTVTHTGRRLVPFLYQRSDYSGRTISISLIEDNAKAEEAERLRFEMHFMDKEWSGDK